MSLFTAILILSCYIGINRKKTINISRALGVLFCAGYAGYLITLYIQA